MLFSDKPPWPNRPQPDNLNHKKMKTVIFANGAMDNPTGAWEIAEKAPLIIAVDGGAEHCRKLNIQPHVLLGDLDSIAPALVQEYQEDRVEVLRFPTDKDKSDLELALDLAAERGATSVTVFAALGLRWDMTIANLLLLAAPCYAAMDIQLMDNKTRIFLIRSRKEVALSVCPGSTVSFLPVGKAAQGVTLQGFKYSIFNQTLSFASTRGVSNQLPTGQGSIAVQSGMLLCIVDES
jgi:thiamine pyrophosphokinase